MSVHDRGANPSDESTPSKISQSLRHGMVYVNLATCLVQISDRSKKTFQL